MKQFRTFFIALALTLEATTFVNAQNSKVAHIATQELIESMPAYKDAMTQLDKLRNTYDAEIKDMMSEAQKTLQRYEAEAETVTEEENQKRSMELQSAEQRIRERSQKASQDLQKKQQDLVRPILEKARNAIQEVARAKGFDYVLDSTTGAGVIMADGYDLMPDVKTKLGI